MAKADFIPSADNDFVIWLDHLTGNLAAKAGDYGVAQQELADLKAAASRFHGAIAFAADAAAAAKQATADKNDSRRAAENMARTLAKRIKASKGYTQGLGAQLSIEGPDTLFDASAAKPSLSGVDQTGGKVSLSFGKQKTDGVNIYSQREGDADWVYLGRATVSPYADNRPLLVPGKPELRRYAAIYMQKDEEVGQFSDDLVVNCAP